MNEYISRIEKGEYELVVRCDDYKDFKAFESLIRDGMDKLKNKEIVTNQFVDVYKSLHTKGLEQVEKECDSCNCKKKEEEINLLKCELNAKSEEVEKLKEELFRLKKSLKERDDMISDLVDCASEAVSFGVRRGQENIMLRCSQSIDAFEKLKKSIGELNKNDVS